MYRVYRAWWKFCADKEIASVFTPTAWIYRAQQVQYVIFGSKRSHHQSHRRENSPCIWIIFTTSWSLKKRCIWSWDDCIGQNPKHREIWSSLHPYADSPSWTVLLWGCSPQYHSWWHPCSQVTRRLVVSAYLMVKFSQFLASLFPKSQFPGHFLLAKRHPRNSAPVQPTAAGQSG